MKRAFIIAIAAVNLVASLEANAFAKDAPRIAVVTMEHHSALGLRLGAEIAELGYAVVPITAEETHDGAVLAVSLERADAVAALTLEEADDGVIACVVERATMHRSCRQVADRNEKLDDGSIVTRSVELLRTLVGDLRAAPPQVAPAAREIEPKSALIMASAKEAPKDQPRSSVLAAHVGPGIFLTSGAPAELVAGVGVEWISISHLAIGLDAALPIAGSSIARKEGSASVRGSTFAVHADGRARVGHIEGELGAGVGVLWLQVNGTAAQPNAAAPSSTFVGVDDSLVDPFVALHAAMNFFFDRTIALRVDTSGAYVLERAEIRFASQNEAQIGRPMLTSTLSLAITWP
ncbi:MAG: hypothetical protein ABI461_16800 [Polyangiaceae bacterium]